MFFVPGKHKDHGLPYNPFKACVLPRPIAWLSTQSISGVCNLAPYSFFNAFADEPPMIGVGIAPDSRKRALKIRFGILSKRKNLFSTLFRGNSVQQ